MTVLRDGIWAKYEQVQTRGKRILEEKKCMIPSILKSDLIIPFSLAQSLILCHFFVCIDRLFSQRILTDPAHHTWKSSNCFHDLTNNHKKQKSGFAMFATCLQLVNLFLATVLDDVALSPHVGH